MNPSAQFATGQTLGARQIEGILRESEAEFRRRGRFQLIFPGYANSISLYKAYFESSTEFGGGAGLGTTSGAGSAQVPSSISSQDSYGLNYLLHQRFLAKGIY